MKTYEVDVEGTTYEVDAPDEKTAWDWANQTHHAQPQPQKQEHGVLHNSAFGALKGASDIGATILSLPDAAARALGVENEYIGRKDRREQIKAFMNDNADTDSAAFKGGELAADIAGTAGAGGVVAKGIRAVAPVAIGADSAPLLHKIANAVEYGGFRTGGLAPVGVAAKAGDMAIRTGGAVANGGISSGLVDPETAGEGAVLGGVVPGVVKGSAALGSGVRTVAGKALGALTGTGSEALGAAYNAGKNGITTFLDNMRGNVPMQDVVESAKQALNDMRIQRGEAYRKGMADVSGDKTVLDLSPIVKSVNDIASRGMYGEKVINKNSASVVDDIKNVVSDWAASDPAQYHTPEGLDALKKAIGDIRDTTQYGTGARNAADAVYNAIKGQITSQAPTYAKVMKDYSEASELVGEIEKSLSLGKKSSADAALRKLQSLMRNNVNTNYGNRLNMAQELENSGADIIPAVAGQALNSWTPRGLATLNTGAGAIASLFNPAVAGALPFTSPRLMGEALYKLGQGVGGVGGAASGKAKALSNLLQNNKTPKISKDDLARLLTLSTAMSAQ